MSVFLHGSVEKVRAAMDELRPVMRAKGLLMRGYARGNEMIVEVPGIEEAAVKLRAGMTVLDESRRSEAAAAAAAMRAADTRRDPDTVSGGNGDDVPPRQ